MGKKDWISMPSIFCGALLLFYLMWWEGGEKAPVSHKFLLGIPGALLIFTGIQEHFKSSVFTIISGLAISLIAAISAYYGEANQLDVAWSGLLGLLVLFYGITNYRYYKLRVEFTIREDQERKREEKERKTKRDEALKKRAS